MTETEIRRRLSGKNKIEGFLNKSMIDVIKIRQFWELYAREIERMHKERGLLRVTVSLNHADMLEITFSSEDGWKCVGKFNMIQMEIDAFTCVRDDIEAMI